MTYALILSACPDSESAGKIAKLLVAEGLAACVQRLPIESSYRWQGEVVSGTEVLLLIKSKSEYFEQISTLIQADHDYELPEIIQIPITNGVPGYLKWIDDCTR